MLELSVCDSLGNELHCGWWFIVNGPPSRWNVYAICKSLDEVDAFLRHKESTRKVVLMLLSRPPSFSFPLLATSRVRTVAHEPGWQIQWEKVARIADIFALPIADFGLAYRLSKGDRHAQEGCRNRRGILTLVLAVEQCFELVLQGRASAVLFCGFECIHGWPVVSPEFVDECDGVPPKLKVNVSRAKEMFAAETPAPANRSITLLSTPHVIGLTKPSGGGGV